MRSVKCVIDRFPHISVAVQLCEIKSLVNAVSISGRMQMMMNDKYLPIKHHHPSMRKSMNIKRLMTFFSDISAFGKYLPTCSGFFGIVHTPNISIPIEMATSVNEKKKESIALRLYGTLFFSFHSSRVAKDICWHQRQTHTLTTFRQPSTIFHEQFFSGRYKFKAIFVSYVLHGACFFPQLKLLFFKKNNWHKIVEFLFNFFLSVPIWTL